LKKIKVGNENQNVFFTSDTHFQHKNIMKYCDRAFNTTEEMDEKMIRNWNKVVGSNDIVFHLGDFIFHRTNNVTRQKEETTAFLSSLNGKKHLVIGNHDGRGTRNADGWEDVHDMLQVKCFGEQSIILCHYAMVVGRSSHHGYWHLFGHSHGTLGRVDDFHSGQSAVAELLKVRKAFDVGVDSWNYTPLSFEQVKDVMSQKEESNVDHHQPRTNG